jgi:Overcoming lysogenization defect protein-like, TOPRIM domain/AAA domain, putative AbiEii toxin, Type IV TA system
VEHLSDFKPLQQVKLPGIGDLRCSGLILIVGPNSSGKSQFLQDLSLRLSGAPRSLVVASEVRISKPEYAPFIRCLESEGYLEQFFDDNGTMHFLPRTTYLGTGQAAGLVQPNQAEQWYKAYVPIEELRGKRSNEFLNYFGRFLFTALFLERRLTSLNQVGVIDFQRQPPQHDLHALFLDDRARQKLFDEVLASFGRAVWPDLSLGNALCLRVSDEDSVPSAEDRLSPSKMARYRTIETEGDGLKSYVATCVSLLLGRRPVCLIDEPEMCLHPPQAYNLGRFIGRTASSPETATFVATHSSHILRGVIQTRSSVQIVRLVRRGRAFSAHLVPADILAGALSKPTVRAESVLDGIFAQCVVVVEADGDRLVYQTVWETLSTELRLDVHFATVGGTGGIADTSKLYRTLNIPIAVVADLDMITEPTRLRRVLEVMTSDDVAQRLGSQASSIIQEIKRLPPTIGPDDLRRSLQTLTEMRMDWNGEEDVQIRRELGRMSQQLDRMRRLKRGGIEAFPEHIANQLSGLLTSLKTAGVFLVPVGELEEWFDTDTIGESKDNKWAWANAASIQVQLKGPSIGGIWDFIRDVSAYLSR